jgi:hypothetical protein
LVVGGVECSIQRNNGLESETIFDVADWVMRQFLELRKEAEQAGESGKRYLAFHSIWIGEVIRPFALIESHKSKFKVFFIHADLRDKDDWVFESSDVEKISAFVANKARAVSTLEW